MSQVDSSSPTPSSQPGATDSSPQEAASEAQIIEAQIQKQLSTRLTKLGSQTGSELASVKAAIDESLRNPIDFPSLSSAILPGDTVAICLRGSTPRINEIIDGALDAVMDCRPATVDILLDETADADCFERVDQVAGTRATVHLHDASVRADLSYLAADADARPIYLNRFMVDADFVLPIVVDHECLPDEASAGIESLVYPAFTDSATRVRLTESQDLTIPSPSPAWLLGIQLITQIAINRDGGICRIESRMRRESTQPPHRDDSESTESDDSLLDHFHHPEKHPAVIVSLAGQSTCHWMRAIDAIQLGARFLDEDGVLILAAMPAGDLPEVVSWTADDTGSGDASEATDSQPAPTSEPTSGAESETLPEWDPMRPRVQTLVDLTRNYRVFILDGGRDGQPPKNAEGEKCRRETETRERLSSQWGIEFLPDTGALGRLVADQSSVGWLKTC